MISTSVPKLKLGRYWFSILSRLDFDTNTVSKRNISTDDSSFAADNCDYSYETMNYRGETTGVNDADFLALVAMQLIINSKSCSRRCRITIIQVPHWNGMIERNSSLLKQYFNFTFLVNRIKYKNSHFGLAK